jgi:group I intron endonuclease
LEQEIKKYCVYIHTNKINGKQYIGQTCQSPEQRWKNGKGYHHNTYFTRAIQKYGWDNFNHEIIKNNLTKEEADVVEKALIKELNTLNPNGYNAKDGGSNGVPSEETRRKLSESHKGHITSEDTKKKIGAASKGRKHSEEVKKKISEVNKGHKVTDETRKKISNSKRKNKTDDKQISTTKPKRKWKEKVVQYGERYKHIKTCDSMSDAARELGINVSNISACCNGKKRHAGGFIWEYYE